MNLAVWAERYGVVRVPACCWFRAGLLSVSAWGVGHFVRDVTEVLTWVWARLCGTGAAGEPRAKRALAVGAATEERGAV